MSIQSLQIQLRRFESQSVVVVGVAVFFGVRKLPGLRWLAIRRLKEVVNLWTFTLLHVGCGLGVDLRYVAAGVPGLVPQYAHDCAFDRRLALGRPRLDLVWRSLIRAHFGLLHLIIIYFLQNK